VPCGGPTQLRRPTSSPEALAFGACYLRGSTFSRHVLSHATWACRTRLAVPDTGGGKCGDCEHNIAVYSQSQTQAVTSCMVGQTQTSFFANPRIIGVKSPSHSQSPVRAGLWQVVGNPEIETPTRNATRCPGPCDSSAMSVGSSPNHYTLSRPLLRDASVRSPASKAAVGL